ncbi:MAG: hypoxanthine phosphoribosyltransferase [Clostridia bacterium]|nr:hypoxanthine phosphoribosyltransferase [Clostridia bacterium]
MRKNIHDDIERILISEEEVDAIARRLADQINRDYADSSRDLVLVCLLKGSIMFTAQLMRYINMPVEVEFMKVSSYGSGTQTSGIINVQLDIKRTDLGNVDVIIVEDIVDSGRTLTKLMALFREKGASSVKTCSMLDKPSRRVVEFKPDYCGTEIPDLFVVGFGLDYAERYRNLPYVGVLKPAVYEKAVKRNI